MTLFCMKCLLSGDFLLHCRVILQGMRASKVSCFAVAKVDPEKEEEPLSWRLCPVHCATQGSPSQRWANNSVFEYIRIVRTEYIRKPNYSVLLKNRIIFVFVFGFNFQTECIRIRIRFLFLNRIHSYSYSVFIFEPNIFVFVFGLYFETE